MKYLAIIQARYNSSRLRGKILMDLCGKPVLQRVVERVKRSKYIDEVAVATGIGKENLPVLSLCAELGTRVFAGAEDDVLDRFYQLAKLLNPAYVVRVTADCPCYDWTLLDEAIRDMRPNTDYCFYEGETLPDGMDIEIIGFEALGRVWEQSVLRSEREHLTQYIHKNKESFIIQSVKNPKGNQGHIRLTLDEEEDFVLISQIYDNFIAQGKEDFLQEDILSYLTANPEQAKINSMYARNEGLAKSLSEDKEMHPLGG